MPTPSSYALILAGNLNVSAMANALVRGSTRPRHNISASTLTFSKFGNMRLENILKDIMKSDEAY